MNRLLVFLILFYFGLSPASAKPNEQRVFFHIHEAIRWAELYYSKNDFLSKSAMRNHLGQIKYNEKELIKSIFYEEFVLLNKMSLNLDLASRSVVEKMREKIHIKAEKQKIKHPESLEGSLI